MSWPSNDFELAIQNELDFLRYFYEKVPDVVGVDCYDLYSLVQDQYAETGGEIPEGYGDDEDDEEDYE